MQFAPAARLEEQLFVASWNPLLAERLMLPSGPVPLFVRVMDSGALVPPRTTLPRFAFVVESDGTPSEAPMPLKVIVAGLPFAPLAVIVSDAVSGPMIDGVKTTGMPQSLPADIGAAQLFVNWKSEAYAPLTVMFETVSGELLISRIATVRAALATPMAWSGKVKLGGTRLIEAVLSGLILATKESFDPIVVCSPPEITGKSNEFVNPAI
jgi:hypothetical protein